MNYRISKMLAMLSTGLVAGAFFYGYANVVPAFYDVPTSVHLMYRKALMNHNSIYMPLLMATAILCTGWTAWEFREKKKVRNLLICAVVLAFTALLTTRFGNVPINLRMRTWNAQVMPVNAGMELHNWNFYNFIRTISAFTSFVLVLASLTFFDSTEVSSINK